MEAIYNLDFLGNFDVKIKVEYPKHNSPIFERWLLDNQHQYDCKSDRVYLPVQWTAYYVNNNYGQDKAAIGKLQSFIDRLPKDIKYWTCIQYDDGILNNVSGIDLLQFNMSKNIGVPMPLLCKLQPYSFSSGKKWLASFVGSRTHPIRDKIEYLKNIEGYYISYENHFIQDYCRILHESMFALCPRGYGINSFRIAEAIQYGAIPVYISDEFINPFNIPFEEIGITITDKSLDKIDEILQSVPIETIIEKQEKLPQIYNDYYTYEGAMTQIIKYLESESASKIEHHNG